MRPLRLALLALFGLCLANCAETTKFDAAGDIHALLIAIRDGDKAGFNAHVDRPALKEQIRARLLAAAAKRADKDGDLAALGLVLARPLVDSVSDALIQPDVFRAVAEYFGYSAETPIPNSFVIASGLRRIDDTTVCAAKKKDSPCILEFRNEAGTWRLVGFEGDIKMLKGPKF
jgi:hypothetical protein